MLVVAQKVFIFGILYLFLQISELKYFLGETIFIVLVISNNNEMLEKNTVYFIIFVF